MPTSAAQAVVTTGTAIKTLLQIKGNGVSLRVKEWGVSFDGSSAATPIKVELLETDGAATVTAAVQKDIIKFDNYYSPNPSLTLSTTGTGYTASDEGTIVNTRMFDVQLVAPTNQYVKQFPLGLEPLLNIAYFLRVRVTAAAAVNAYAYVLFEI